MSSTDERHLVVIGAGITGLAAAWEASAHDGWRVTVVESTDRLGGKLRTSRFGGRMIDEGADAFLRRVPEGLDLCAELGLDDLVSPASSAGAKVWVDGRLVRLPEGLVLGVPVDDDALAASGILSPDGLARAVAEPTVADAPLTGSTTVGAYVRAHYGDEVLDRLVEPLIGGIYAGTADDMDLDAAAPQLATVAHRAASMTEELRAERAATPPVPGTPVFGAPRQGMEAMVTALGAALLARGATVLTGTVVEGIIPDRRPGGNGPVTVAIRTGGEAGGSRELEADAVIVATPAGPAADLVSSAVGADDGGREAVALLRSISYASVVLATLSYHRADVPVALDATGFLVPRSADLRITAASWATTKWGHLTGPGQDADTADPVILRVSIGHADDPGAIDLDDDEVLATMGRDLATTMGIDAAPLEQRISRWRDGFPQYPVGHLDRVARIDALLAAAAPGVTVTGSAHRGLGVPACIRQGRAAAAAAVAGRGPR